VALCSRKIDERQRLAAAVRQITLSASFTALARFWLVCSADVDETTRVPVMTGTSNLLSLGLLVVLAGSGLGCGSGISGTGSGATLQTLQPVDEEVAKKAQTSCWFKVANRSSNREEVRLWKASSPVGATTGRLGDLLIVSGAMEPAVRDARYYGCSLFEYQPGVPVVMMATATPMPVRADNVIPFGFAKDGRKNLK
jgi:hypothetical protein